MEYTKERLETKARHWEGISINDRLAGRSPTPMITVEMEVDEWERIWAKDSAPDLYEALKAMASPSSPISPKQAHEMADKALAKAEGKG